MEEYCLLLLHLRLFIFADLCSDFQGSDFDYEPWRLENLRALKKTFDPHEIVKLVSAR